MERELHLITRRGDGRGWESVAFAHRAGGRPVVVLAGEAVAESEESVQGLLGGRPSAADLPILAVREDARGAGLGERWAVVDYAALLDLLLEAGVAVCW